MTKEATSYYDDEVLDAQDEKDSSEGVKLEDILNSIRGMIDSNQGFSPRSNIDRSKEVEDYLEFQEVSSEQETDSQEYAAEPIHIEESDNEIKGEEILELTDIVEPITVEDKSAAVQELISEKVKQKSADIISDFSHQAQESNKPKQNDRNQDELETVVHKLMRPLIKQWLDANLPDIVERVVSDEIKKLVPKK